MAWLLRWTVAGSLALLGAACGDDGEPQGSTSEASTGGAASTGIVDGSTGSGAEETAGSSSGGTGEDDGLPFEPAGPDAAPDPSAMGPFPVGVMTVELLDESRLDDMGQPRRLVTEIWYPAVEEARDQPGYEYTAEDLLTEEARALLGVDIEAVLATDAVRDAAPRDTDDRFPIILFSHGSSGVRMQSTFLTVYLASHGYVVGSPDHLGNTLSDTVVLGGPDTAEFTEAQFESLSQRPDDMVYVLEYLQGIPEDDALGAIVDDDRVGAAGHSFGALTTLRLLGQGRPIDAAVAQAPPGYEIVWFGALPNEPEDLTMPVMIQAGELDYTTPLEDAVGIHERMTAPRSLLNVYDGGHFTFSDLCLLDPEAIAAIGLSSWLADGCTDEQISPDLALPLQRHFAIGLFNGHLRDSPGSLELMTPEAADPLAPGMFELSYEP